MNLNYESVPDIITGKDLDYLTDIFEWNYSAYKKMQNCIKDVNDENIKNELEKASNMFMNNLNKVLSKLQEGDNSNE